MNCLTITANNNHLKELDIIRFYNTFDRIQRLVRLYEIESYHCQCSIQQFIICSKINYEVLDFLNKLSIIEEESGIFVEISISKISSTTKLMDKFKQFISPKKESSWI